MEQLDRLATHSPAPPNLTQSPHAHAKRLPPTPQHAHAHRAQHAASHASASPAHDTQDARAPPARRRLVTHRYARLPAAASPARYGTAAVLRGCLTPLGEASVYCSPRPWRAHSQLKRP